MVRRITSSRIVLRLIGLAVIFLALISLTGCPVVIPAAVNYYQTSDAYVATVALKLDAEKVYSEIVSLTEEKEKQGKIEITNKAKQILYLEATDGVQTAGLKVNKVGKGISNIVITSDVPDTDELSEELEKDREKELAHKIIREVCQRLNQNCTLVER